MIKGAARRTALAIAACAAVAAQANAGTKTTAPAPLYLMIPAPTNLVRTSDPHVCGSRAGALGGLACAAAFSNGWLVLVFDWSATKQNPSVEAFNVYEVDNGMHALVDHNTLQGAAVGIVQTPAGGFANRCYVVTALVNGAESAPSNALCLGGGSLGPITSAFTSVASQSRYQLHYVGLGTHPVPCTKSASPLLCLGHTYNETTAGPIVTYHYNEIDRAFYKFDLSSLAGHYVIKATFRPRYRGGNAACYAELAAADIDWTSAASGNGMIGGNFVSPSGTLASGLDVTTVVRSWLLNQPNYGFVLRGVSEDMGSDFNGNTCWTDLDPSAELDIVHS